jgi:hypothetical protein
MILQQVTLNTVYRLAHPLKSCLKIGSAPFVAHPKTNLPKKADKIGFYMGLSKLYQHQTKLN